MSLIVFSTFALAQTVIGMVFFLKLADKMPGECQDLVSRIAQMLPTFGGKNPDLRSCAFFVTIAGMAVWLVLVIFI